MFEFHLLRVILGLMQLAIVVVLLQRDIGYLVRFGVLMFVSGAMNLAPAYPDDESWKYFLQVPTYAVILALMIDATIEFFAFLRRRTFIEERGALLVFAAIVGLIPVWIFWVWPGDNWYQNVMLIREYVLMWLAAGFLAAWCWLRAVRPVYTEHRIADHGEFWGFWLISAAALASTTKHGAIWRFSEWKGSEDLWRIATDVALLAQVCICVGFLVNLRSWKDDAAPAVLPDPPAPGLTQLRRLPNP